MIKEIETAIINAIKNGVPSFRTVRGYNGDFEAVTEETVSTIIKLFPAALVIYDGSDFIRSGNRVQRNPRLAVILAAKSLRGEADPTMRQGLYDLLGAVMDLLDNNDLGLAISPLLITRERLLFNSPVMSVYAQEYETDVNTI